MSRNVQYTGPRDQRIRHAPYCKSPHPNAIVACTCPASSDLNYNTRLAEMSVDQYDMLYRAAPMPVHKLKAIRHKRHVLQPDNPNFWPKDRAGQPYNPRKYGYPANWLDVGPPTLLDQRGEPLPPPAPTPDQAREAHWQLEYRDQYTTPDPPSVPSAPTRAKNFWEEEVTPEQQQRWHEDPTYNPEPEFSPEKLHRMEQRRRSTPPAPPPVYPTAPTYPAPPPVYPTAAQTPQQRESYLQAPPMTPHTRQQCRAPLIADVPGSTTPIVVECETEPNHTGAPHMARIPGRRPSQVIYLTWMDE